MQLNKRRFGELLIDAGLITDKDLTLALSEQRAPKERLGEALIRLKLVTEGQVAIALADQLGLPFVDLATTAVESEAIQLIPERLARRHTVLPVSLYQNVLQVAVADPLRLDAVEDVRFAAGCAVRLSVATLSDIRRGIDQHYHVSISLDTLVKDLQGNRTIEVLTDRPELDSIDARDLKRKSEAAPIIRMVNMIISQAIEQGASDIHLEPLRSTVAIRNRVDGILNLSFEAPKWVQGPVTSRIKIMAKLDIAEKRLPQDGRITVKVGPKSFDLRVSTTPTLHGEKVVIRLLDTSNSNAPLEMLGFGEQELTPILKMVRQPQGLILVTGPTGAGKTSTLYAMLNHVRSVENNILTIEDPIEYELPGINQAAVNEKTGLTFGTMLRATLRQDPDIIMVGEIRDADTAAMAMQASITGHLVLSTMHTNSAVATITRLRDLGVPPYLVASALSGVIAQRLVRTVCASCKTPAPFDQSELAQLGVRGLRRLQGSVGAGCGECKGTGYKGRTGVFEVLTVNAAVRESISSSAREAELWRDALEGGMTTLLAAGIAKVKEGVTTVSEVLRAIGAGEDHVGLCRNCGEAVDRDFVACPACQHRLNASCRNCHRPMVATWTMCPYCCTVASAGDLAPGSVLAAARSRADLVSERAP